MKEYIESEFDKIAANFLALKALAPEIQAVADVCINTLKRGNKIACSSKTCKYSRDMEE